jgi:hypothetical protein
MVMAKQKLTLEQILAWADAHKALLGPRLVRREAVPEKQPLPPVRPPQGWVVGGDLVLLAPTGADNQGVVGLHDDYPPELIDRVGIGVAVGCRVEVPGVWPRARGTLQLAENHHVSGPKTGGHAALPSPLIPG